MPDLEMEGKFDQFKGKLREMWGDLRDDDFDRAQGNMEQMIGRIKERSGEAEDDIRRKLEPLWNEHYSSADRR